MRIEHSVRASRVMAPPFFSRFAVMATISVAAATANPNFHGQNIRSR
jgi:hypothetical protein